MEAEKEDIEGQEKEDEKGGYEEVKSEVEDHPVVLFDGVCNLCTGYVKFIIPRDPEGKFYFASLQSEIGEELARDCGVSTDELETIVLVDDGKCYTKSSAVLRIARHLGGVYRLAVVLKIFPKFFRDFFYDFVAKRRYNWFGKKDKCMVPTPENRKRFLDGDGVSDISSGKDESSTLREDHRRIVE